MITFDDIRKGVRELNIFPNQLFDKDDMKKDAVYGRILEDFENTKKQVIDLTAERDKVNSDLTTLKRTAALSTANSRLKQLTPENLTDKQKKFIENNFNPEKLQDLSDDSLKTFVGNSLDEFKKVAEIFGDSQTNTGSESNTGSDTLTPDNDDETAVLNTILGKTS